MINIYIKSLSGDIETLNFTKEQVTIYDIKITLKKKGYITHLFKSEETKEDSEEENKDLPDNFVVSNNDILCVFYSRKEFTQEELKRFEQKIKSRIGFFPEFKETIMKNKAILAGGSVLAAFGNYNINDFDIYVNYSNAKNLLIELNLLGFNCYNVNIAPAYDESFFRKNNIIARFFMLPEGTLYQGQNLYLSHYVNIDVMVIPDKIPIENVVTNFDLTFCQVWWDGEKLHSFDIEDVRSKSGSLNKDYINAYLDMNTFIVNRIRKYKKRGFKINIEISSVKRIIKNEEKQFDNEEWAVKAILKDINCFFEKNLSIFTINFQIEENTLSSLYKILDKNIIDSFIVSFYAEKCIYFKEQYRSAYLEIFSYIMDNLREEDALEIRNEWIRRKQEEFKLFITSLKEQRKEIFKQKEIFYRHRYAMNVHR